MLEWGLFAVVVLALLGLAGRDLYLRHVAKQEVGRCEICTKPAALPLPRAIRPVWHNRIHPHMGRVYGTPPERQIVFGRGRLRLCEDHGLAAFRKLECFHAKQLAAELEVIRQHASVAATYESGELLGELRVEARGAQ